MPPPRSAPARPAARPHVSSGSILLPFGPYAGASLAWAAADPVARAYLARLAAEAQDPRWRAAAAATLAGAPVPDAARLAAAARIVITGARAAPAQAEGDAAANPDADTRWLVVRLPRVAAYVAAVAEAPGHYFDPRTRRWFVPVAAGPALVDALGGADAVSCDRRATAAIAAERARRATLARARARTDADAATAEARARAVEDATPFVVPTRRPLYPFQIRGVRFAVTAQRDGGGAYIADEMGLGKTPQGIGVAEWYAANDPVTRDAGRPFRTLVVAPNSLVPGWTREIQAFSRHLACLWTAAGPTPNVEARYHVIHNDALERHRARLDALGFDLVVVDEVHRYANADTAWARALFGVPGEGRRPAVPGLTAFGVAPRYRLVLSGTPVPKEPLDLFPVLHWLAPVRFPSRDAFVRAYVAPGRVAARLAKARARAEAAGRTLTHVGEERIAELASARALAHLFRALRPVMVRRYQEDVLPELPRLQEEHVIVPLDAATRAAYVAEEAALLDDVTSGGAINAVTIRPLYRAMEPAKLAAAWGLIDGLIAEGRRAILFSLSKRPVALTAERYGAQGATITGALTPAQRQATVDRLQRGEISVIALTMAAGRDGLTIHRADTVIFLDRWWLPSWQDQAKKRIHRIGVEQWGHAALRALFLVAEDTVDVDMTASLAAVDDVTSRIADGEVRTVLRHRSVLGDVRRRLLTRIEAHAGGTTGPAGDAAAPPTARRPVLPPGPLTLFGPG